MSDWTILTGTGNYGMGPMHRGSTVQGISGTPVPRAPLGAPRTNGFMTIFLSQDSKIERDSSKNKRTAFKNCQCKVLLDFYF